jgi:hypothetical protein
MGIARGLMPQNGAFLAQNMGKLLKKKAAPLGGFRLLRLQDSSCFSRHGH